MDHEAAMLAMIDDFLAGRIEFDTFAQAFQEHYIDVVPDTAPLTDDQWEFFGMVHEKLDWTDRQPDPESRRYGWIDRAEYLVWLRSARARYPAPA